MTAGLKFKPAVCVDQQVCAPPPHKVPSKLMKQIGKSQACPRGCMVCTCDPTISDIAHLAAVLKIAMSIPKRLSYFITHISHFKQT